ncbi:MAG: hypothetical protein KF901_03050 [Myxococcales bacterium]|nr:hypothetical protein [Myxococcales bacterium]
MRDRSAQAIASLAVARAWLVRDDRGAVRGVFDEDVLGPRARVPGDDEVAVEQAHLGVARDQGERAIRRFGRDRVAVGVERDERGLVGGDALDEVGREPAARQREQTLALFSEDLGAGAFALRRVPPLHRDVLEEVEERRVSDLDRGDDPRREEAGLEVADAALDAALVGRLADAARAQRYVHRAGELDEVGLKADGATFARGDDALRVVEEPLVADTAEVLRRGAGRVDSSLRRWRTRPGRRRPRRRCPGRRRCVHRRCRAR